MLQLPCGKVSGARAPCKGFLAGAIVTVLRRGPPASARAVATAGPPCPHFPSHLQPVQLQPARTLVGSGMVLPWPEAPAPVLNSAPCPGHHHSQGQAAQKAIVKSPHSEKPLPGERQGPASPLHPRLGSAMAWPTDKCLLEWFSPQSRPSAGGWADTHEPSSCKARNQVHRQRSLCSDSAEANTGAWATAATCLWSVRFCW